MYIVFSLLMSLYRMRNTECTWKVILCKIVCITLYIDKFFYSIFILKASIGSSFLPLFMAYFWNYIYKSSQMTFTNDVPTTKVTSFAQYHGDELLPQMFPGESPITSTMVTWEESNYINKLFSWEIFKWHLYSSNRRGYPVVKWEHS